MRFGGAKSSSGGASSSQPAFYEWKIAGQAFSIQLSYELIDRLNSDVMKGFWAVPKRGAEVGGVLLGRVMAASALTSGDAIVFIEDYELVNCEHRRGPSYVLSENDRKRLERAVRHSGEQQVVGYFRSHTRPGLYLDEDDMSVVRALFSGPSDVVLLIRPYASKPSMAGFFFWEEEDMRRHSTYKEFVFNRAELQPPPEPEPEIAAPVVAAAAAAGAAVAAAPALAPAPAPFVRHLNWKWPLATAAVLAGLGAIEYQVMSLVHTRAAVAAESVAALHVDRNGAYLQVSWDRHAPAVTRARSGVLHISDGQYARELALDSDHLQSGSVAYSPLGNDVSFRLELRDGKRNVSESVRVVTAPPAEPAGEEHGEAVLTARVKGTPRTDEPAAAATPKVEVALKPKPRVARTRTAWADDGL